MEAKTKKKRAEKRSVRKKEDPVVVSAELETAEPKKKSAKKRNRVSKKRAEPIAPTYEQIQLRAYFISEQRRINGIEGDERGDWLRAERELREELLAEKSSVRN
jgi:hypothetical protein